MAYSSTNASYCSAPALQSCDVLVIVFVPAVYVSEGVCAWGSEHCDPTAAIDQRPRSHLAVDNSLSGGVDPRGIEDALGSDCLDHIQRRSRPHRRTANLTDARVCRATGAHRNNAPPLLHYKWGNLLSAISKIQLLFTCLFFERLKIQSSLERMSRKRAYQNKVTLTSKVCRLIPDNNSCIE